MVEASASKTIKEVLLGSLPIEQLFQPENISSRELMKPLMEKASRN